MNQSTLNSLIRRESLSIREDLTEHEVFTSPYFKNYIDSLVSAVTEQYEERISVSLFHEPENDTTAFTDGKAITVNTGNHLAMGYNDLCNKFSACLGLVFHETAHILYNDFDSNRVYNMCIDMGKLYGGMPERQTQEEQMLLEEMEAALAKEEYRPIFKSIANNIFNSLADPRDEDHLMLEKSGSLVRNGIMLLREVLITTAASYDDMKESDEYTKLAIIFSLLLQYARFGEILIKDESLWQDEEAEELAVLRQMAPHIDMARDTYDSDVIAAQVNEILFALYPVFQEELLNQMDQMQQQSQSDDASDPESGSPSSGSNSQTGPSSSGSANSSSGKTTGSSSANNDVGNNGTTQQQAIQNVLDQLTQGAESSGQTQAPQNTTTSRAAKQNAMNQASGSQQQSGNNHNGVEQSPKNTAAEESALNSIMAKIADSIAEDHASQQLLKGNLEKIRGVNQNTTHKGKSVIIEQQTEVYPNDIEIYEREIKELKPYSTRLQKRVKEKLREQQGDILHKRNSGKIFEARNAYRPDQRYYAKKSMPNNVSMAVSVLVDHSGSMGVYSSPRILSAMKATILLHDFARALDIPIAIAGHNTYGGGIRYYTYTDYEHVKKNEKYRLAKMITSTDTANRDGMAIEVAANLLSKRPEEIRLLIIISDGQPNDIGYGDEEAAKDIRSIVQRYRRQGVEVIAAAIGEDKENIKEIYGLDSFLDISNLEYLPKKLLNLLAKRLLS